MIEKKVDSKKGFGEKVNTSIPIKKTFGIEINKVPVKPISLTKEKRFLKKLCRVPRNSWKW
ncbi:MAG: hypothetical protein CM1200mP16_16920 [Nitrospina sp.]|nr:MAG: hypothetical protein CM1200mP16_16920 [Nitrospina sp.]